MFHRPPDRIGDGAGEPRFCLWQTTCQGARGEKTTLQGHLGPRGVTNRKATQGSRPADFKTASTGRYAAGDSWDAKMDGNSARSWSRLPEELRRNEAGQSRTGTVRFRTLKSGKPASTPAMLCGSCPAWHWARHDAVLACKCRHKCCVEQSPAPKPGCAITRGLQ